MYAMFVRDPDSPAQPLRFRILMESLRRGQVLEQEQSVARHLWDDRCTYCGCYHFVHEAERLAPWVRAVAQPSDVFVDPVHGDPISRT